MVEQAVQTKVSKPLPKPSVVDIRDQAVQIATRMIGKRSRQLDYGESDVAKVLKAVKSTLMWKLGDGVPALVRKAQIRRAYRADGRPQPGDIVLFHNQFDRNANFEMDDWHTGCGIVILTRPDRFEAVIRSGFSARKVVASPQYPSVRMHRSDVINSFVRIPRPSDSDDSEYLAGQLYAGHIDLTKIVNR